MKIITEPKIRVIGATQFFPHPDYPIPMDDEDTDLERIAAFAAKACYDSFGSEGRSVKDNQRQIMSGAHGSVLAHPTLNIFVEGISRGLSLELNRHAAHMGISQRSTRYVDEKDSAMVLSPYLASIWKRGNFALSDTPMNGISLDSNQWLSWDMSGSNISYNEQITLTTAIEAFARSEAAYISLISSLLKEADPSLSKTDKRKWARGIARDVLPSALETREVLTCGLREWRWIIESRTERHAESEIRRFGVLLYNTIKDWSPVHFEDFNTGGVVHGIPEIVPQYRKV